MNLTKKALNALLVAERAKSRTKAKRSHFMTRTRGIYSGQENRYFEASGKKKLPYSLEALRRACERALDAPCFYCGLKMTTKTMCPDHKESIAQGGRFTLANLRIIHQNCNWHKGKMNEDQFVWFRRQVMKLPAIIQADIWRRLALGGKWLKA